eukprot:CAMPEP_0181445024 /NCGR_PEP_ID=MMETSP1110-20121109/25376_1 /TAXON_ID=174948 /ORGANISM="Symbiodinium sp., Strain CCMP421" /LENGTH=196 /DNA_ID=CAMNT_0023569059 /DNA_START=50 /DNA_END=636 /DNA_ORIENTATION=-
MAQPVTYTGSETAQPIMTYQPMDAGQPMTAAAAEATYYVDQNGQPVTFVDEMGQPVQYVTQGAPIGYDIPQPMTYIQGADGLQPATSMVLGSPYAYSPYAPALDHSQGKWFAPGEELPPGFIPVAHPEGHVQPQETHAMTDAVKSMTGLAGAAPPAKAAKAEKKKGKKKRAQRLLLSGRDLWALGALEGSEGRLLR